MTEMTFDTLAFSKTLKESGFSEEQSEGVTQAVSVAFKKDENLVTNDHLEIQLALIRKDLDVQTASLRKDLDVQTASLRKDLDVQTASLRKDIEVSKAELKAELLKWMFAMLAAQTALIIGVLSKILP